MNADSPAPVERFDVQTEALPELKLPNGVEKPRRRRSGWLLLALLPLGAVAVPAVMRPTTEAAPPVSALPVQTTALTPVSRYQVERTYTGEVVARRTSNLGFEQPGTVVDLLVDEGDRVTAGQPLARLDTRTLQAQRQQLVAQRDQAMAQLQELQAGPRPEDIAAAQAAVADLEQQVSLARLQRQRREDLYQRGAISREELDQQTFGTGSLESRLDQARSQLQELQAGTRQEQVSAQSARVRQLDASLQSIEIDLSKSVLTAPFSGSVSQRSVDEGVVVSGGQPVLTLIEGGTLEARIGVPTDVAKTLSVGDAQSVELADTTYPATITALLPELDATSRTVTVVLELHTDIPLTVGQTARLKLVETQATDGFWLPSTALVPGERGLWSVYVVAAGDANTPATVARRDVEVLHTAGDRTLVRGTLQPGEQAITSGTQRIVPGQPVKPLL